MRGIIIFNYRILLLTIIGICAAPVLAMHNLEIIAEAAYNGDLETIKALDPNGENRTLTSESNADTPLYIAAAHGYLAIVKYYIEKLEAQGKDINPVIMTGLCSGLR